MNIIDLLKIYDKKYADGQPEISDTDYDMMREEAKELFPEDPYFESVGVPGEKVKLPYVMGSLNKMKIDTVLDWLKKTGKNFIVSEKVDGASFLVIYEDGKPIAGYRRGDGELGTDITDKVKLFCPEIYSSGRWVFRGEAVLDKDPADFGYKNRRNGASGLLNKDGTENCQHLKAYFYEIVEAPDDLNMESVPNNEWTEERRWEIIEELWGTQNNPMWWTLNGPFVDGETEDRLVALLQSAREHDRYDVDGLVITLNDSDREDVLYPTFKIAFKVNLDAVKTTVEDIEWSVTRTGRIVPVVIIRPIGIQGVTVSRVTGHNFELLSKMGAGIGAEVGIVRSGDVIPYIEEVYTASGDLGHTTTCPSCYNETGLEGVDIVCVNKRCPEKVYYELEYWFRTLGAENITAVTLKKLGDHIDNSEPPTIFQIYDLSINELMRIEGFGERRATQVYDEIQGTMNTTHEKLLAAFAIPNVGNTVAADLIRQFGSIHNVLNASYKELTEVEGIGITVGSYIRGNQYTCNETLEELEYLGLKLKERATGVLDGKILCITGKLPMKRDALVRMIESKGGTWKNSVTKKTNYLVTDNPSSGSSKNKKAEQYGTEIIDFNQLQEMCNE